MKLDLKNLEQLARDYKSVESVYCVACVEDETGQKCECLACQWENETTPRKILALLDRIRKLEAVREAAINERKKIVDIWPEPLDADDTAPLSKALKACEGGSDD